MDKDFEDHAASIAKGIVLYGNRDAQQRVREALQSAILDAIRWAADNASLSKLRGAGEPVAEVQLHPHDASKAIVVALVDFEVVDVGMQLYDAPQASAEASTIEDLKKLFRQERDRAGAMRKSLERISDLRGTAGFERTSITNEVQVFANEIARAALNLKSAPAAEAVPFPKREDVTSEMRAGFERLFSEARKHNHATLARNEQGAYRDLRVDSDWVFYQRAWADAIADRQQRGGGVDERTAFERWATSTGYEPGTPTVGLMWAGWQARAALAPQPRSVVVGRVTIKGKGQSSVDLDTSHVDLPEGDYELVVRAAIAQQGKEK